MHAHCPLIRFFLFLLRVHFVPSHSLTLCFSLFRARSSSPVCSSEAECVRRSSPPSSPLLLFSDGFSSSPSASNARTPLRFSLPALSHLLHCHPFPTFCSLTNRAAREYIFYRHSWWPPHICANLPGLALACLGHRLAPFEREQYRIYPS